MGYDVGAYELIFAADCCGKLPPAIVLVSPRVEGKVNQAVDSDSGTADGGGGAAGGFLGGFKFAA